MKNALVTGASSGLGRGLAAHYARQGVRVYAAARRKDALESLQAEVGPLVVPLALDVARADETFERVKALDAECGGLDLVVANAGLGVPSHGKKVKWEPVRQMLEVNVLGATATLLAALPGMVERRRGHLVGVSSIAAFTAFPKMGAYSGSKAYLSLLLDSLRADVEDVGIAVTAVHPGFVRTEMTQKRKAEAMPFLMELEPAVRRIVQGIDRRETSVVFPLPMELIVKGIAALPGPLYRQAIKWLG